jgi:DNA-binding helix-hairpin-helix protein with protein kinase domain
LSHRANWGVFRRHVQRHFLPPNLRLENQDALPPRLRAIPDSPKQSRENQHEDLSPSNSRWSLFPRRNKPLVRR